MRFSTALVVLNIAFALPVAQADSVVPWVARGAVQNVLDMGDGRIAHVGNFQQRGPLTGPLVQVDSGEIITTFPELVGTIHHIEPDPYGGFYVGGEFVVDTDVTWHNLVRIDAEGQLDSDWRPNPSGAVHAIEVNDAGVFVGGSFGTIAGESRGAVARFAPDGTLDEWAIQLRGVTDIMTMDDSVLIAGHFQSAGVTRGSGGLIGVSQEQPARITWRSGLTYLPQPVSVALTEDRLILCGGFDELLESGQGVHIRQGLAALDRESGKILDLRVSLGDQESIHSCVLHNDTLYLGGGFTSVNGLPRQGLAALDLEGQVVHWEAPALEIGRSKVTLQVFEDELYILGDVVSYSSYLGALSGFSVHTGERRAFPVINEPVKAFAFDARGNMIIGGDFNRVGDHRRRYLAFMDDQGSLTALDAGLDGPVSNVWHAHDRVWVTGEFNGANRYWCPGFLVLDDNAQVTWCPNTNGVVNAVVAFGEHLVIAGNFSEFDGQPVQGLVFLNEDMSFSPATPTFETGESRVAFSDAVVHEDHLYLIQSWHSDTAFWRRLLTIDIQGEQQGVSLPGIDASRLIYTGKELSVVSPQGIVKIDLETGEQQQIELENRSIYIHPRYTGVHVDGRYIVGSNRSIGGSNQYLAATGPDEGPLFPNLPLNQPVHAMRQHGETVWVASDPARSRQTPVGGVLRINLRNDTVQGVPGLAPTGQVTVMAQASEVQVFGGNASTYLAKESEPIIITDHFGVPDSQWEPEASISAIYSADLHAGTLYACARMGQGNVVAGIDMTSGKTRWSRPVTTQHHHCVLRVHGERLYLGGITRIENDSGRLAILDLDGEVQEVGLVDGAIVSITRSDERLFLAGPFNHFRGLARPGFVEIDDRGEVTPWTTDVLTHRQFVRAVVPFNDMYVILGGFDTEIEGRRIRNIVAVDDAGTLLDWQPNQSFSSSFTAATRHGDLLLVAGMFDHLWEGDGDLRTREYIPRYGIAALDGAGRVLDWNPGVYRQQPGDLLVVDNRLYVAWSSMGRQPDRFTRAGRVHPSVATLGPKALPELADPKEAP